MPIGWREPRDTRGSSQLATPAVQKPHGHAADAGGRCGQIGRSAKIALPSVRGEPLTSEPVHSEAKAHRAANLSTRSDSCPLVAIIPRAAYPLDGETPPLAVLRNLRHDFDLRRSTRAGPRLEPRAARPMFRPFRWLPGRERGAAGDPTARQRARLQTTLAPRRATGRAPA